MRSIESIRYEGESEIFSGNIKTDIFSFYPFFEFLSKLFRYSAEYIPVNNYLYLSPPTSQLEKEIDLLLKEYRCISANLL
jgi:hypothetical protein